MNILLCSDLHITDTVLEEYRWVFLEQQLPALVETKAIDKVFILGDTIDRKDRHSSALVNRLVNALVKIKALGTQVVILAGNHDLPISGTPYWSFLNCLGIKYVTKPSSDGYILLLPFSSDPIQEWKNLEFNKYQCILMHQTVSGALIEGGRVLESSTQLPIFPRGMAIYSGDVHCPQVLGSIVYVGCPYPTRFGEAWGGRVLLLDSENFKDYKEVKLPCISRRIVDVASSSEFEDLILMVDDQIRVRYHLKTNLLDKWPGEEEAIKTLAKRKGVQLLSVEAVLEEVVSSANKEVAQPAALEMLSPEETLKMFCKEENLDESLLNIGLEILKAS